MSSPSQSSSLPEKVSLDSPPVRKIQFANVYHRFAFEICHMHTNRIIHFVNPFLESSVTFAEVDRSRLQWLCTLGITQIDSLENMGVLYGLPDLAKAYLVVCRKTEKDLVGLISARESNDSIILENAQLLKDAYVSFEKDDGFFKKQLPSRRRRGHFTEFSFSSFLLGVAFGAVVTAFAAVGLAKKH